MYYLLEIRRGWRLWRLPIADRTASLLEEALLEESTSRRAAVLTSAVAGDPYLAIWVAEQVHKAGDTGRVETAQQAAAWLAEHTALKLLDGVAEPVVAVPAADARRYASAAVAWDEPRGDETRCVDDGPPWWHAVCQDGDALLEACPCDEIGSRRLLPGFSPCVFEACTPEESAGGAMHEVNGRIRRQYLLEEVAGVGQRLPGLVRRLAGLERTAEAFERALHERKLAALKELAYGASHEINNPLANIAARAQTLMRDEADPQRRRKLTAIFEQAMRAHEMIADLMLFAQPPQLVPTVCNLTTIVRQTVESLADDAAAQEIDLTCAAPDDVEVVADPTQLGVAIGAVVKNALEAVGHSGHVEVSVEVDDAQAFLVISDDGPGMSERVRAHLFDPFFSGREAGRGLGFGLCKCWRIVTDHGGRVEVRSSEPSGTQFTISLPRRQAA